MAETSPRGVVDARVDAADDRQRPGEEEQRDDEKADHAYRVAPRFDHVESGSALKRSDELIVQTRSATPAIACPWPMHMVAIP